MKKQVLIHICLFLTLCLTAGAQSLTVEYNIGYGTYQMSGMKSWLQDANEPVTNMKVTDNFPGYLTPDARIGMEWGRHHTGLLFNYMNTAGKKGVSDYSGSYKWEIKDKGYKIGAFYRFRLLETTVGQLKLCPYAQFSTGVVVNSVRVNNELSLNIPDGTVGEQDKLSGTNFFLEPAVGCKLHFCRFAALNLSVGYEWDVAQNLKVTTESNAVAPFKADWSGLRAQAGIICYLKFKE